MAEENILSEIRQDKNKKLLLGAFVLVIIAAIIFAIMTKSWEGVAAAILVVIVAIFISIFNPNNFYPKYTETSVFLMLLTSVLIAFFDVECRKILFELINPGAYNWAPEGWWLMIFPLLLFLLLVVIILTLNLFSDRKMSELEKIPLRIFVGLVTLVTSFALFFYSLKDLNWFLMGLSLWNATFAIGILKMRRHTPEVIFKEKTKTAEIIVGSFLVVIIFIISHFVFKNYWAVTFGICLGYTSMLNRFFTKLFSLKKIKA